MEPTSSRGQQDENKRKRKRASKDGNILNYPNIPHVPMDMIPLLIEAIKLSTRFFTRYEKPYSSATLEQNQQDEGRHLASKNNTTDNHVHQNLMNRVRCASDAASISKIKQEEERLERMNHAARVWMEAVKKFARIQQKRQPSSPKVQLESTTVAKDEKEIPSVPYANFLYLWKLQQEHSRVAVRRAALFLSALLLQKAKDCRFHLEQDSNLSKWVTSIATNSIQTTTAQNSETSSKQLVLLQHEASMLLSTLVELGYARIYPKIGVAAKRIQQHCPDLATAAADSTVPFTQNMPRWRQMRDFALEHGTKEIKRLGKLLRQSQICLEVLVPRIGHEPTTTPSYRNNNTFQRLQQDMVGKETEDEDDDVAWEDGEEDDELDEEESQLLTAAHHQNDSEVYHLLAVDRTMAAMQATAGSFMGGEIEIDMTADNPSVKNVSESEKQQDPQTRNDFQKLVQLLASRHLPRLSLWLDGLNNADNLVMNQSHSLVLLPSESMARRQALLEQLTELKRSVTSILSSATRLQLLEINTPEKAFGKKMIVPRLWESNKEHASLTFSIAKKAKDSKARSSQIKIRYKSR